MLQNRILSEEEFSKYHLGIIKSYEENFNNFCPSITELKNIFFVNSSEIDVAILLEISNNIYIDSYIKRLIGIREIIYCRDNNLDLDIKIVWKLVKESINLIPSNFTISSIGSQGFLSIPLYKEDRDQKEFDFLRLHIWDESLDKLMDLEKNENFAIHTHTFFARSWIITGKIINNRFDYEITDNNPTHSLFKVKYNDSINNVNKHTSNAINENINISIIKTSEEVHFPKSYYEIKAGKLHKSGHLGKSNCSATFFSFTGKEGLATSIVVGPKEIQSSEVNRKVNIDPKELLLKIDKQLI